MVAPVRRSRTLGWGMVLVLFMISGVSTYTTIERYAQRRSPAQQQLKVLGRQPLPVETRKWIASPPGSIELTGGIAVGTFGLGIVGAVAMTVTSPRRASGPGSRCVDCGRPIESGTLCASCETS